MGTAHYILRSFFSSKLLISILTLALCFLPPGYELWAWCLLLDRSVLYSTYPLHIRYSHLWINWKTPEGAFLEGKPMPDATPELLSVRDRQLRLGSIHSYCRRNGSMKLLTAKIVYAQAFQPWIKHS